MLIGKCSDHTVSNPWRWQSAHYSLILFLLRVDTEWGVGCCWCLWCELWYYIQNGLLIGTELLVKLAVCIQEVIIMLLMQILIFVSFHRYLVSCSDLKHLLSIVEVQTYPAVWQVYSSGDITSHQYFLTHFQVQENWSQVLTAHTPATFRSSSLYRLSTHQITLFQVYSGSGVFHYLVTM